MRSAHALGMASAILIVTANASATPSAGGLGMMCAEGLALGAGVESDSSVSTVLGGKTYCFGNETARTLFERSGRKPGKREGVLRQDEAIV